MRAAHTRHRLLVALIAAISGAAAGATITVTADADQFANGTGCSLREAVEAANRDGDFDACNGAGYDRDAGAAERQQIGLAPGADNPGSRTVAGGETGVAMLQIAVTNTGDEAIDGASPTVTIAGSGSGDEARDVSGPG